MNQEETRKSDEERSPDLASPATGGTRGIERREILKALAGVPVLGWVFWRAFRKKGLDDYKKDQILSELGDLGSGPAVITDMRHAQGEKIRLGIIGYGGEGRWLTWCAGFVPKSYTDTWTEQLQEDRKHTALRDFLAQTDLNIEITAVCDVYDVRAEQALDSSSNDTRPGGGRGLKGAKRYTHYHDLLQADDVDAVLIATPDHWHTQMTIDAAAEGKHVYLEKCMTRTEQEARDIYRAVKDSGIAFQLGHQNRQVESHEKARQIIEKGILGPINLIETTTNRNTPNGAWVYNIEEEGTPETINWDLFQGPAPHKVPFSPERFFRWRCWYDYGTGLSGDLFSHEYDTVNQILDLGIPRTVAASGGIYFYNRRAFREKELYVREMRDVPDVFHINCEYPDRNLTLVYSATLSNSRGRGVLFMGHDATMEVGGNLTVWADDSSWAEDVKTRFEDKIVEGVIDPSLPLFRFQQGSERIDAVTSASDQYFISRGLMYTYRGGQRFPTNHLHIAEWLDVIRNGGETSCNIDRGFEEAITCHMATRSYLEGRRVEWDPIRRRIV